MKQAVGKKTSFRRDCDASHKTVLQWIQVGKKTSFRRDCDFPASRTLKMALVGKKTSFRRDCDFLFRRRRFVFQQERRPHLEGIATQYDRKRPSFCECRKEDLIQKGLRLSSSLGCNPPKEQERRPHLEGIATLRRRFFCVFCRRKEDLIQKGLRHDTLEPPSSLAVGKKTSFRRDCDFTLPCKACATFVGKKTSFRRDCDLRALLLC